MSYSMMLDMNEEVCVLNILDNIVETTTQDVERLFMVNKTKAVALLNTLITGGLVKTV